MPDMLVNLLKLPDDRADVERLAAEGITIRRINAYERSILHKFVLETFSQGWADEVMSAFSNLPTTCFVATRDKKIIGFAAYDCTRRNFFGPTGVDPVYRGSGVGKVLLLACLRAMLEGGYAYAIIGGVGPADFYTKCCGATLIPDSTPGVFADPLEQ